MLSCLGLEAMMSRLGLGRFGPRSRSDCLFSFVVFCITVQMVQQRSDGQVV